MAGEWDWDDAWTSSSINATAIANASTATTATISNDGKLGTLVGVTVAYGATVNEGVKVYVLMDVNGTFESVADNPYGFELPGTVSTTHRRSFVVPAEYGDDFQVHITNDSGAQVTADIDYKQAAVAA